LLVVFVRALILYVVVVIMMRIMGKRQIGQLQPFELAVAIMVSELAAVPMQNTGIPLVNGIIPILTLLIAQVLTSLLTLKSVTARSIICGKPSILIENGKISEEQLQKEMYTLNDLLEQLRIKNSPNIADVEFAILETNGQLSVIPKSQARPLEPRDINIPTSYEGVSLDLIIDGQVIQRNMKKAEVDIRWLQTELHRRGFKSPEDILFAALDTAGNFYCQGRSKK
jgi:uncharacterized membrane protein YcaP (DUF421 family)